MNPNAPVKLTVDLSGFDSQVNQMLQSTKNVEELLIRFNRLAENIEYEITDKVKESIDIILKEKTTLTKKQQTLQKNIESLEEKQQNLTESIRQKSKLLRSLQK